MHPAGLPRHYCRRLLRRVRQPWARQRYGRGSWCGQHPRRSDARLRWRAVHTTRLHRHHRRRLLRRVRQPGRAGRRICRRGSGADLGWRRSLDDHRWLRPTAVDRARLATGSRRRFQDHQTSPLRFPAAPVRSARRWTHACSAGTCDRPRTGDHEESAGPGGEAELPQLRLPGWSIAGRPARAY
jgi:hypothetical protein